jgi:hypothetical protein
VQDPAASGDEYPRSVMVVVAALAKAAGSDVKAGSVMARK